MCPPVDIVAEVNRGWPRWDGARGEEVVTVVAATRSQRKIERDRERERVGKRERGRKLALVAQGCSFIICRAGRP